MDMKFKADKGSLKNVSINDSGNQAIKVISEDLLKNVRGGSFTRTFDRVTST
jgi:hypothetical protein